MKIALMVMALHFFADFTLQGVLADLKCRDWWTRQLHDMGFHQHDALKYQDDYKAALFYHAFYWSVVTFAPVWYFASDTAAFAIVFANAIVHMVIDHFKCNLFTLNLWQDQSLHFIQIALTLAIFNAEVA